MAYCCSFESAIYFSGTSQGLVTVMLAVLRSASPQKLDSCLRVWADLRVSVAEDFKPLANVLAILFGILVALFIALLSLSRLRLLDGIVIAHKLVHLNKVPDDVFIALKPRVA